MAAYTHELMPAARCHFLPLFSNIYLVFAPVVCDVNTICPLLLGKLVYERIYSMCVDGRGALPGKVMLPGFVRPQSAWNHSWTFFNQVRIY